ncbi:MAG TPA: zinc ABC transporter substrate-binding protein [Phycisphaerae bacterium]|jgi:zinc transport system substrate-binding protein|nr:zinc ABC transporter substrate-binding protein [Phycisphaerae bacterium]HPM23408.1 zinc ABC transporter substrate-binding protein [Phycisphaerae bacterium]HQL54419.1 zinc ABC transporter substrate-binding protein [Phycisphaerae bacterium]
MQRLVISVVLISTVAFARAQQPSAGRLSVAVSILPQAYFVERVGGEHVNVEVLVGPGQSPHAFEPTPKQLEGLSRARVYFTVGIDFEEALLPRIRQMFNDLKVVDTRAGVPLRSMTATEAEAEAAHEHGHDHHHDADHKHADHAPTGRPDPHIWLNPLFVKTQAQTICAALTEFDPSHAEQFRANLAAFHADLDRVHARITEALAPLKGREVFVYHPAFGYFTDAYGLKQVPVEIEGKEPTARQLAELITRARSAGVRVIFVQPQFGRKSAEAVANAIGGAVVPMDDLARDYLKNLEAMAAQIKTGLEKRPG